MPIRRFLKKYWFKPARLGWVAVYYPVLFPGWVLTFACLFFLFYYFAISSSLATTFWDFCELFVPKAVIIFLIFDLACFRTGEYPSWWRNRGSHITHE